MDVQARNGRKKKLPQPLTLARHQCGRTLTLLLWHNTRHPSSTPKPLPHTWSPNRATATSTPRKPITTTQSQQDRAKMQAPSDEDDGEATVRPPWSGDDDSVTTSRHQRRQSRTEATMGWCDDKGAGQWGDDDDDATAGWSSRHTATTDPGIRQL
ncbi:hypothetical protein EDB89DRAFT_1912603 [Lactarius sanguifluus]|nr:hypothetical protein EDB89DRAFT_1912603 [Lactarius sanguifluus]